MKEQGPMEQDEGLLVYAAVAAIALGNNPKWADFSCRELAQSCFAFAEAMVAEAKARGLFSERDH